MSTTCWSLLVRKKIISRSKVIVQKQSDAPIFWEVSEKRKTGTSFSNAIFLCLEN
jgi:hypothetical protein